MREETREHRYEQTFALVPPSERLRLRGNSSHGLPRVVVESADKQQSRKSKKGCIRKLLRPTFWIIAAIFIVDFFSDYFFSSMTTMSPPIIQRDYSHVNGVKDVIVEFVTSRCFHKQPSCKCTDTTMASSREDLPDWARVHHLNKEAAKDREDDVDVLFLGDSLTEGWLGMSYGRKNAVVHDVPNVFKSLFSIQDEGVYEGLALGISGDTAPNLLWRIQNGELPSNLNPSVIWVLIGTNDFGTMWCSAEMVLIGIIRVVEELLMRKPASTIVVNGLLPRTYNRKGYVGKGRSRKWWRSKSLPAMPSMWDDIEAVNEELKNYANNREKVEYFESRVFFVDSKAPDESLQIDGKLMPDFFHPSADGYRLWGEEIVQKLKVLIPSA